MNWIKKTVILLFVALSFSGCGLYSFSGVSLPPEVESISIAFIENKAPIVAPNLSPTLTDKIRNKFLTQTNLNLIGDNGDIAMEGTVIDYNISPVGAADNSTASKNRLQITVQITVASPKATQLEFNQTFRQFEDFDASKNISDVEAELIETISDNLAQEIFNKTALNW